MKTILISLILLGSTAILSNAQEGTAELSKKARNGFITEAVAVDGGYNVTYKMAGDKKKDEVTYETYSFGKDLKFLKSDQASEPKKTAADKPDRTVNSIEAFVGGCTSFDILSMKLRFTKSSIAQTWDYKTQRYVTDKVLSSETFKPKSENGKYRGYAAFNSPVDEALFVLAGADDKDNKRVTDYFILNATADGDIAEKPVDITGAQSLVYADQVADGDVVLVFAPHSGSADISQYTYLKYACDGTMKNKCTFKSPSNNLLVLNAQEKDGSIFFCATSSKKDDAYDDVYSEYAGAISNPCFTDGENKLDARWAKDADGKMEHFHLLKFTGNNFDFGSTANISEFKEKFKTTEADRHADPYKGKKFYVESFTITPAGEYLIAGQLTGREKTGSSSSVKTYEDIVCMHFDKSGQLRAQYGVEKMNNDKKSSAFPINQSFIPSKDGKSLYWEIMEVKGFKGYASFVDAYNGNQTWYSAYFPRISKLDPNSMTLGDFKVLGDENYYIRKNVNPIINSDGSVVFVGSDENGKNLWLAKYDFQ